MKVSQLTIETFQSRNPLEPETLLKPAHRGPAPGRSIPASHTSHTCFPHSAAEGPASGAATRGPGQAGEEVAAAVVCVATHPHGRLHGPPHEQGHGQVHGHPHGRMHGPPHERRHGQVHRHPHGRTHGPPHERHGQVHRHPHGRMHGPRLNKDMDKYMDTRLAFRMTACMATHMTACMDN
eukprot:364368-Chlamydomonas_euryale.AAC.2